MKCKYSVPSWLSETVKITETENNTEIIKLLTIDRGWNNQNVINEN